MRLHLEEPTGATTFADSAHNLIPTCTNCPSSGQLGRYGNALNFDGSDDRLILASSTVASTTTELGLYDSSFTVMAWIKGDDFNSSGDNAILGTSTTEANQGLHLIIRDGQPYFGFYHDDTTSTTLLESNQWYHLTWRYDKSSGEQAIFVDGVLDVAQTGKAPFTGTGEVSVGRWRGSRYFDGLIDELIIYDRPLSAETIYHIANPLDIGISEVQVRLRHPHNPHNNMWRPASLSQHNNLTTWSYTLDSREGPYQLDLQVTDNNGHNHTLPSLWTGSIDTQAPRLNLSYVDNGNGTATVSCAATDFNLSTTNWVCPVANSYRSAAYETAAWFTNIFGSHQQLVSLSTSEETVAAGSQVMTACDVHGQCATTNTTCTAYLDSNGSIYSSQDASALQTALDNALAGDMIKVAGSCFGSQTRAGDQQTLYIDKDITLAGGYVTTDWSAPTPGHVTILDAQNNGRVVTIAPGGYQVSLTNLFLSHGYGSQNGTGLYNEDGHVTLNHVTIHHNETTNYGGAIYNNSNGTITLSQSRLSHNQADNNGGGLRNNGHLIIEDSDISHNTARNYGGGLQNKNGDVTISGTTFHHNVATNQSGGAIYNNGTGRLHLSRSNLHHNQAGNTSGGLRNDYIATVSHSSLSYNSTTGSGGGIRNHGGSLTVTHTLINDNVSHSQSGGGIISHNGGSLTVSHSRFQGNVAGNNGGGLRNNGHLSLTHSDLSYNTAANYGGGFFNKNGIATLSHSSINHNTAISQSGGGILNTGTGRLSLNHINLDYNTAGNDGGGLRNGHIINLQNSSLNGNTATNFGGGIHNLGGILTVTHTMLSDNTALNHSGGGLQNNDGGIASLIATTVNHNSAGNHGGGVRNDGNMTLHNSSLSSNNASSHGGGLYNNGSLNVINSTLVSNTTGLNSHGAYFVSGTALVSNTILAYHGGSNCTLSGGGLTSHGYNLSSDATCPFTATDDLNSIDPLLRPLTDNGGPTLTHALHSHSPAIDHIPAGFSGCATTITTDQRGHGRPQNSQCDSGAYEYSNN